MVGLTVLVALLGSLGVWAGWRRSTSVGRGSLQLAFEAAGLELTPVAPAESARGVWTWSCGGRSGPIDVRLESFRPGEKPRITLELALETAPTLQLQIHFAKQAWSVLGDEALAAGVASGELREVVEPGDQLLLSEGTVTLLTEDAPGAGRAARALEDIALRLAAHRYDEDPVGALLEDVVSSDKCPEARAGAVPHLLARNPGRAEALAHDAAPEVRLAVARVLGGERGFELASEILTSEILEPTQQKGALRWLLAHYSAERVAPVLSGALRAADEAVLRALVTAIGGLGARDAVRALRGELPTAELRTAARIGEALVRLEGSKAERALLELLARLPPWGPQLPEEVEAAVSAVDGLGQIGGRRALGPLRTLDRVVSSESELGLALRVAIDLVRTRLGDAALPGALALAETRVEGGRLAYAPSSTPEGHGSGRR